MLNDIQQKHHFLSLGVVMAKLRRVIGTAEVDEGKVTEFMEQFGHVMTDVSTHFKGMIDCKVIFHVHDFDIYKLIAEKQYHS
jgi:hypothetical protein